MTNYTEPDTHIDIKVVKNLLLTRVNEGMEIIKSQAASPEWNKTERLFLKKCREAIKTIDEAINIKEGKFNETSKNSYASENHAGDRQTGIQNQGDKA
jgi:hypothetical protein